MVRVFPIRKLKPGFIGGGKHRGSQLYFHITRYMLKEEGRALFLLPKVKVEFRTFLRFKNGLVFALPIKLNQISLFFAD
jgi:hypothetical protein